MRYFLTIICAVLISISFAGAQGRSEKSTSIVTIEGESYYVHSVKSGENLYGLSKLYGVPEDKIKEINPHVRGGLRDDHVLKIPFTNTDIDRMSSRKQARLFDTHIVVAGENLYRISLRYQIPVNTLIEDNEGLDPAHLSIGQQLNIRKKSVGDATPAQIEQQMENYEVAINSVSEDYEYYLVKSGDTLYSLGRQFGVSEQQLTDLNSLTDGLKAGALIKVRPKEAEVGQHGTVSEPSMEELPKDDIVLPGDMTVKDYSGLSTVDIAMLMPLEGGSASAGKNFLEFYQGALLALEDLKNQGISVKMSLYNTGRSADEVRGLVNSRDFGDPDIMIGPVYEDEMQPAVDYAQRHRIVMVSPLGAAESIQSPVLYQMAPDASAKYDKVKELFTPGKNIIFITTPAKDGEMENNIRPLLPDGYKLIDYTTSMRTQKGAFERVLATMVDTGGDNLFVISCVNEQMADRILADISSYHWNLVARSQMKGNVAVLGGSGWSTFDKNIIDKGLFFKLNVCYISSYHADRGNEVVQDFDRRFISSYGVLPTLYAYRGYDAVKLFGGSVRSSGATYTDKLNTGRQTLLQMPYRFSQKERRGTYYNIEWGLVCYGSDFTITVK